MPDGFLDFFFATFWRFFTVFWHFLVVFCHFLPLFSSNFPLGISVRNFRTDMPNVKFVIFCQNWPKPWSSMFGGRYLRQRTALGSESTAPQTETTLGLPTGQKRRICGKNVINLLILGFFLTFLAINLQADLWRILGISLFFFFHFFCCFSVCDWPVAKSRSFIGFFRLTIQRMQNAPPSREKKKRKKKQTGKPRLNLTRSLQQGNSR